MSYQQPVGQGHWEWHGTTGYKWVMPGIISGPGIKKITNPDGSQTWGPYAKTYTKSMFGQNLFTPPDTVDGVNLLCQCRFINQYMRGTKGEASLSGQSALLFSSNRPACWEDSTSIMNPQGGDSFTVTLGHPAFYGYALNRGGLIGLTTGFRGLGGKKSKRRQHNKKNQTRKLR